jgi:hypothetical protein
MAFPKIYSAQRQFQNWGHPLGICGIVVQLTKSRQASYRRTAQHKMRRTKQTPNARKRCYQTVSSVRWQHYLEGNSVLLWINIYSRVDRSSTRHYLTSGQRSNLGMYSASPLVRLMRSQYRTTTAHGVLSYPDINSDHSCPR